MSLQYNGFFEKTNCRVVMSRSRVRTIVCDSGPYSSEQYDDLEAALSAALGADFVSFSWDEETHKQTWSVVFHGTMDEELEMEVPGTVPDTIEATVNTWLASL